MKNALIALFLGISVTALAIGAEVPKPVSEGEFHSIGSNPQDPNRVVDIARECVATLQKDSPPLCLGMGSGKGMSKARRLHAGTAVVVARKSGAPLWVLGCGNDIRCNPTNWIPLDADARIDCAPQASAEFDPNLVRDPATGLLPDEAGKLLPEGVTPRRVGPVLADPNRPVREWFDSGDKKESTVASPSDAASRTWSGKKKFWVTFGSIVGGGVIAALVANDDDSREQGSRGPAQPPPP